MSMTYAPTGGTRGAVEFPEWFKKIGRRVQAPTSMNTDAVAREIADVISAWEAGSLSETEPLPYPRTAVDAVRFISEQLAMPVIDVVNAVGVAEKSFYNWANKGNQPRKESLGQLWPMTQVLYTLVQGHPGFLAWFHSSAPAQAAFAAGDANALALAEMSWAMSTYAAEVRTVPNFDYIQDGEPDVPPSVPVARIRKTSKVPPSAVRRERASRDA